MTFCGPVTTVGGVHPEPPTVTVAVALLSDPQLLETRTQYAVVDVSGGVVYCAAVAPLIGFDESPLCPTYH